ncbi:MAG: 50S ribosomal protein L6 [Deltaproteobacteria bacterium]|nr:50S ribosomal protein L6 [Deltaproteobacteria bacterium]
MSRIGKKPILIPDKVKLSLVGSQITVQGGKGKLTHFLHPSVELRIEGGVVSIIKKIEDKKTDALQGLTRSLVANMVTGVHAGFQRNLEVNGIGYRASVSGNVLALSLGYSHPVNFDLPDGISATVDKSNTITLSGIDKELLGRTAATIRQLRSPEPYKGKGIKYAEEHIQRKAGKTGTK